MKRLLVLVVLVAAALFFTAPAFAVDVTVSGDLNNRFNLYNNQSQYWSGAETIKKSGIIEKDGNSAFWGDIKYRLYSTVSTNDGAIKGVYGIELGALRFGQADYSKGGGGGYSGDGVNIETRYAYTDFQLPFVQDKARVTIGLQPFMVNHYVWQETAMGVQLAGATSGLDYKVAWMRGREDFPTNDSPNSFQDADGFLLRGDMKPMEGTKLGLFGLYQRERAEGNGAIPTSMPYEIKQIGTGLDYDLYTIGTDGAFKTPTQGGDFFVNWDLIYQGGTIDTGDIDVSGYFLHADVGMDLGKLRLTYTGWYASGDDDDNDDEFNNFMSTDVDMFDSVVLFEGGYTDDNYFTEAPYILNKGMIFNKIAADYKFSDKVKAGAALLYLMTAEDLEWSVNGTDYSEDTLGTELDAYVSYMLYPNTEFAVNFGYLFADDAMDYWEAANIQDGSSDEDLFRSTARIRYKF